MKNCRCICRALIAAALVLTVPSAPAVYETPVIQPPNPVASQQVTAVIRVTGPDFAFYQGPLQRLVEIVGQTVRLTIDVGQQLPGFPPVGTADYAYDIGSFPPGAYSLEVYGRSVQLGTTRLVTSTTFTVGAAPVPALGPSAVFGLMLGLGVTGLLLSRRRLAHS